MTRRKIWCSDMTNVPETLREMWKDIYVLFDSHYLMKNTIAAWDEYWDKAKAITEKYGYSDELIDLILCVTAFISQKMRETANVEGSE